MTELMEQKELVEEQIPNTVAKVATTKEMGFFYSGLVTGLILVVGGSYLNKKVVKIIKEKEAKRKASKEAKVEESEQTIIDAEFDEIEMSSEE